MEGKTETAETYYSMLRLREWFLLEKKRIQMHTRGVIIVTKFLHDWNISDSRLSSKWHDIT